MTIKIESTRHILGVEAYKLESINQIQGADFMLYCCIGGGGEGRGGRGAHRGNPPVSAFNLVVSRIACIKVSPYALFTTGICTNLGLCGPLGHWILVHVGSE